MNDTKTLDLILSRLSKVKRTHNGYEACCPVHDDQHPSLSITPKEDCILLHCQRNCPTESVVAALGLTMADLFDEPLSDKKPEILETYDYADAFGAMLYQVVRMVPKSFRQRRPNGNGGWDWSLGDVPRVLYRLSKVLDQVAKGAWVFVCEGEKDVHALESLGFVATTNAAGAGKWRDEYSACLSGGHVCVLPDNDDIGRLHADQIAASLLGKAEVRIVHLPGLPEKGDVSDWIRAGGTAEALKEMVKNPPLVGPRGTKTMSEVIRDVGRYKSEVMPLGIDYPWAAIQALTRGLRPGWFCILAGYPGMGKTAAALDIAFHAAKHNKKVLFNSLEMGEEEVAFRMIQRWGLDTERLYAGKLNDKDIRAFDDAAACRAYENIVYSSEGKMESLTLLVDECKPDLVVVDYITLMDFGKMEETEGTAKLSRALCELAKTRKVPVLCLSQLSRPHDKTNIPAPTMFALKNSGALEADAHQILFSHRNQENDIHTPVSEGRFIVAKSRMGKTGAMRFSFDGEQQIFKAIASGEEIAQSQGWSVYQGGREA